jgi:hypothetical protein
MSISQKTINQLLRKRGKNETKKTTNIHIAMIFDLKLLLQILFIVLIFILYIRFKKIGELRVGGQTFK